MKYKELFDFIKIRFKQGSKKFDDSLLCALNIVIIKERLDIYEKLLIYAPELTQKNLDYINERISSNKAMLSENESKMLNNNMWMKEKKKDIDVNLNNYLDELQTFTNTILIDNDGIVRPRLGYAIYDNTNIRPTDGLYNININEIPTPGQIRAIDYQTGIEPQFRVRTEDGRLINLTRTQMIATGYTMGDVQE